MALGQGTNLGSMHSCASSVQGLHLRRFPEGEDIAEVTCDCLVICDCKSRDAKANAAGTGNARDSGRMAELAKERRRRDATMSLNLS